MRIETDSFAFVIPDGWTYFTENGRLVCQGPDSHELIVNVRNIRNATGETSPEHLDVLFGNALNAITQTIREESLVVDEPLSLEEVGDLRLARVTAQAWSDGTLFSQLAIRAPGAVMFATLETPECPSHRDSFNAFARSVEANGPKTAA